MALTLTTTTRDDTGTGVLTTFVLTATAPDTVTDLFLVKRTGAASVSADTSELLAVASPEDVLTFSTSPDSDGILLSPSASVCFATEAKAQAFVLKIKADLTDMAVAMRDSRFLSASVSGSDSVSASDVLAVAPFLFSA
jgi:hypothetical protein